jgi:hypothetical protein
MQKPEEENKNNLISYHTAFFVYKNAIGDVYSYGIGFGFL